MKATLSVTYAAKRYSHVLIHSYLSTFMNWVESLNYLTFIYYGFKTIGFMNQKQFQTVFHRYCNVVLKTIYVFIMFHFNPKTECGDYIFYLLKDFIIIFYNLIDLRLNWYFFNIFIIICESRSGPSKSLSRFFHSPVRTARALVYNQCKAWSVHARILSAVHFPEPNSWSVRCKHTKFFLEFPTLVESSSKVHPHFRIYLFILL